MRFWPKNLDQSVSTYFSVGLSNYLNRIGGVVPTPHEEETSHCSDAGYGIRDGHEGAVEGGGDAPHCVIPHYTAQAQSGHHGGERGVRRNYPQT